jgi:hypothetical protein
VSEQTNSKQSKAVVDAYYQAGVRRRLTDFAQYLHPDFLTTAPNYLPWGGVHPGAAFFRDEVLRLRGLVRRARPRGCAREFRCHGERRYDQDLRALDRARGQSNFNLGRLFRTPGVA